MTKRYYHAWGREELSLLLRAWAEESARAKHKNLSSAVFLRFQALCRDAGFAHSRAEPSVDYKVKAMRNMHAVISVFLAAVHSPDTHAGSTDTAAALREDTSASSQQGCIDSGDSGDATSYGAGSMRAWLAMPEHRRRRCFTAINKKSYLFVDITQEQFDLIHSILTKDGENECVLPEAYLDSAFELGSEQVVTVIDSKKARLERKTKAEPLTAMCSAISAIVDASKQFRTAMEHFKSKKPFGVNESTVDGDPTGAAQAEDRAQEWLIPPLLIPESLVKTVKSATPPPPESSDLAAEDSGSSTESEDEWDEIVPRSPVHEEESVTTTVAFATKQEPEALDHDCGSGVADSTTLKRSFTPTEPVHSEKRSRGVQPEVSMLLDALEHQAFALKDVLRKATDARYRDQTERKQILKHLRQEQYVRHSMLESLKRQEEEIRRQRAEWRREQDELRHEWANSRGNLSR